MPEVSIPIVGPYDLSRSKPWNAQVTQNCFIDLNPDAKTQSILLGRYGLSLFSSGNGADRGLGVHKGKLYQVSGTQLDYVSSVGNRSDLGDIPKTTPCSLATNDTQLGIATGGPGFYYDTTLKQITNSNWQSPNTLAFNNQRFVCDGAGGKFFVTGLGDINTIDGLDTATAERAPDDTIAVGASKKGYVYLFGEESIEPWWNSGVGDPPYDPVSQEILPVGTVSPYAVASIDNEDLFFFLNQKRQPYMLQGLSAQYIGHPAIDKELKDFSTSCRAIAYNIEGHGFYELSDGNKTFVYQVGVGWAQYTSGTGVSRHKASSYAYCYDKHLVADHSTGDIYEMDYDTFTDNGSTIIAQRDSAPLRGADFGLPGRRMFVSNLTIVMETGTTPVTTGQGSKPQIMVCWSTDGGYTFSTEVWPSMGEQGKYHTKVQIPGSLGSFEDHTGWVLRLKISDPVPRKILDVTVNLEPGL